MSKHDLLVVAGSGGFIGGHLVKKLREEGFQKIRAVDQKPISEWYQVFDDVENYALDLSELDSCRTATKGAALVYNLAADMGGMGFIELNEAHAQRFNQHPPPSSCIWGDGHQTRSFMYIDDCVKGTRMIMDSNFAEPINLGSSELVSINQLVDIVEEIAGTKLTRKYTRVAPKGVNGRNSDNTLIQKIFHWEPSTRLRVGMEHTYRWIYDQMIAREPALHVVCS